MKLALRIAAGLALLALAIWYVDPRALVRSLAGVDPWLFAAAVGVSILSNLGSATRWSSIARGLGLVAPVFTSIVMYARGITANMMLPGALVGGDVLRSYQLSRLGNPLVASAWSVFLDRFSGLWVLCGMSAVATLVAALVAVEVAAIEPLVVWPETSTLLTYAGLLAVAVLLPLLPLPLRGQGRLREMVESIHRARPVLLRSAGFSFVVQLLAAGTLWICGLAVGANVPYPLMLAAAAPIFIMASLPIGVAGFGAREAASVAVLGAIGVPGGEAFTIGLLYGLAAVVQGILAAPLFLAKA